MPNVPFSLGQKASDPRFPRSQDPPCSHIKPFSRSSQEILLSQSVQILYHPVIGQYLKLLVRKQYCQK